MVHGISMPLYHYRTKALYLSKVKEFADNKLYEIIGFVSEDLDSIVVAREVPNHNFLITSLGYSFP